MRGNDALVAAASDTRVPFPRPPSPIIPPAREHAHSPLMYALRLGLRLPLPSKAVCRPRARAVKIRFVRILASPYGHVLFFPAQLLLGLLAHTPCPLRQRSSPAHLPAASSPSCQGFLGDPTRSASCLHHRFPPPRSRLASTYVLDLSSSLASSSRLTASTARPRSSDQIPPEQSSILPDQRHRRDYIHHTYIVMQFDTMQQASCPLRSPDRHQQNPHRRRHHHRRPVVAPVITGTLRISSKAPTPMQNEQCHILGILSILSIRPVRPDSSAIARCWRAEATQRAASRPHHRHRDLIVSIVAGTYIISTYHHRHRAERAAPLVSKLTRPSSISCDQILSKPSTQPSSPARQDASIISNLCDQVLSATSAFCSL
eukprot:COSAG01_NODE_7609_length_3128_cov_12.190162_3_plen_373_part_00